MGKPIPFSFYIGKKYSYLTILTEVGRNKNSQRIVLARCDCGTEKEFALYRILSNNTKSCGCYNRKRTSETATKHGMHGTSLYNTWNGMKARCNNPNASNYEWYGGKGVKVCEEWNSNFTAFKNWALKNGWKPGLELDKDIKGNGFLYSPENCMFVKQAINKGVRKEKLIYTIDGQSKSLNEWCKIYKISYSLVFGRMGKNKMSIIQALTTPSSKGGKMAKYKITSTEVEQIIKYKKDGKSGPKISKLIGHSETIVYKVLNNKEYRSNILNKY